MVRYRRIQYGSIVSDISKMYRAMGDSDEIEFSKLCEFFEYNVIGMPIDRDRLLKMLINRGWVKESLTKVVRTNRLGEDEMVTKVTLVLTKAVN